MTGNIQTVLLIRINIQRKSDVHEEASFEEFYGVKYKQSQLRLAIGQREWSSDGRSENRINQFLWFQLAITQVRRAILTGGIVYQSANRLSFDRQDSDWEIGIRGISRRGSSRSLNCLKSIANVSGTCTLVCASTYLWENYINKLPFTRLIVRCWMKPPDGRQ